MTLNLNLKKEEKKLKDLKKQALNEFETLDDFLKYDSWSEGRAH